LCICSVPPYSESPVQILLLETMIDVPFKIFTRVAPHHRVLCHISGDIAVANLLGFPDIFLIQSQPNNVSLYNSTPVSHFEPNTTDNPSST
jgi:hypothetical protein